MLTVDARAKQFEHVLMTSPKQTELHAQPCSIRVVKGQLWVAECEGTIDIFTATAKTTLIQTIDHKDEHEVIYDVVEAENGHVILATQTGLAYLETAADVAPTFIDRGDFKSVDAANGLLYAYDYVQGTINVYTFDAGAWTKERCFKPPYDVKTFATIRVQNDTCLICSMDADKIYSTDLNGELLQSYGDTGKQMPGRLSYPSLCQQDAAGSILVADHDNHRIQMMDATGKWSVLVQLGAQEFPRGAAQVGSKLYVVSYGSTNQLTTYG